MVKTSDFESENSGSSPGEAASIAALQAILEQAELIIQRAFLIVPGPPFNMQAEEEHAQLDIDGAKATLSWPEYEGGYYAGDGSMQTQTVSFPSELLLMSIDEIHLWKAEAKRDYDAKEKARLNRERLDCERLQTARELQALAALKAKYEGV